MSSTQNPYGSYNFTVTIDGVAAASFTECILANVSFDVIEYRNGADPVGNVHKLQGLARYGNLVLKRGVDNNLALWNWVKGFLDGSGNLTTVGVTLLDSKRLPVVTWTYTKCWPVKYEGPVLNGQTSALAIENLEIAVDSVAVTPSSQ